MKLVMLGAPGSGKGTQAAYVAERLAIPAISTGAILREAIAADDGIGRRAREFVDAGRLVPDALMIEIVERRIAEPDCQNGFILDGFPRTIPQAEALEAAVRLDTALSIEVSDDKIERRMTGRRSCADCGRIYHTDHNPPKADGVCDACGGALTRRADDAPETVKKRLKIYHEQTEPVKGFYEKLGRLKLVRGLDSLADTRAAIFEALGI